MQAENWNCKFRETSAKIDEGIVEAFIEISDFVEKKRIEKEVLDRNQKKKNKFGLGRNKCIIQ